MKLTNRKDIRKAFKTIGYKVSFKSNPFNRNLCNIAFLPMILDNPAQKPIIISSANCYSKELIGKHKTAFDLANKYKGCLLEDTEQKIS